MGVSYIWPGLEIICLCLSKFIELYRILLYVNYSSGNMTEHLNQYQIVVVYPSTHYPMHTHCKNTVLKIDYTLYLIIYFLLKNISKAFFIISNSSSLSWTVSMVVLKALMVYICFSLNFLTSDLVFRLYYSRLLCKKEIPSLRTQLLWLTNSKIGKLLR